MFIYSSWYVAATDREVEPDKVLARTILGEPIALYRKTDGSVAALRDQCCHRLAPLSLGAVVDDTLRCGYHGFRFDGAGRCVEIPGQAKIPSRAKVRAYPIIERYGFVWIWMGNPELAGDDSTIPDALRVLNQPGWDSRASYVHVKSGYRLIVDNLQDASHAEYVHLKTLRVVGMGEAMRKSDKVPERSYRFELVNGHIQHHWRVLNAPGGPSFVKGLCLQNGLDYEALKAKPVDWTLETVWYPPVVWTFNPTTMLSGAKPETAATWTNVIAITPETESTTHYFWADAQSFNPKDGRIAEFYHKATQEAFAEDVVVFEAQQRRIGSGDVMDFDVVTVSGDTASVQARRILNALKAKEVDYAPEQDRPALTRAPELPPKNGLVRSP